MKITAQEFLNARFDDNTTSRFDVYENGQYEGKRWMGDLWQLLEEFAEIRECQNLAEVKNPRSKRYVIIDKDKGYIITTLKKSILKTK